MSALNQFLAIGFPEKQSEELRREFSELGYMGKSSPSAEEAVCQEQIVVLKFALKVFGDAEICVSWLSKKMKNLGGESPLSLLKTREGVSKVGDLLNQIDSGFSA